VLSTGKLTLGIIGLPTGAASAVAVTGPGGFGVTVTASQTISNLTAGTYNVTAQSVVSGSYTYAGVPALQIVTIAASTQPYLANVAYTVATGAIDLGITGLPVGAPVSVVVEGPGGYSSTVSSGRVLPALAPGTYTITAPAVTVSGTIYAVAPQSFSVAVAAGSTASANVAYAPVLGGLNLTIDAMYLTQSVQTYTGSVPLVKDKDAYLRVFVKATVANNAAPPVRVRFYKGGALMSTQSISPVTLSVPLTIDEGAVPQSWNLLVPGSLIQPGLSIDAIVDPTGLVAESNEADNMFPVSGIPLPIDVHTAPPFAVRFVPVFQSATGLQGSVSDANKDNFLDLTRRMHPIVSTDADVRAAYTTSAPALQSSNTNNAWQTILSELDALRVADGSAKNYYGVVKTSYSSGVAGIGYVTGRTALGWDFLPSGGEVAAHEWGHNWSRSHTPTCLPAPPSADPCAGGTLPYSGCSLPTGADPTYPYAEGRIGKFGFDVANLQLKAPTQFDIMGYCPPKWISDVTYLAILNYRQAVGGGVAAATEASAQPALLVWGRVGAEGLVLEPAFEVTTRPVVPVTGGPYTIEGLDADGSRLFSYSFAGEEVADAEGAERQFAFAIPSSIASLDRLVTLRLAGSGRQVALTSSIMSARPGTRTFSLATVPIIALSAQQQAPGSVTLTWDPLTYPMALVRDPRTGTILSFARGGATTIAASGDQLELVLSDRVHSVSRLVTITPR
jgi:hypothetical protein